MMAAIASVNEELLLPLDHESVTANKALKPTPESTIPVSTAFLHANSEVYGWLVEKTHFIDRRKRAESVLRRIAKIALFAGQFHPGRFADGAVENVALDIGAKLNDFVADTRDFALPMTLRREGRRVLHVASNVLGIGGHTRMLYYHVRNDRSSCHSLVLTDQSDVAIPVWLSEAVQNSGGYLVVFPAGAPLCQKAQWLREMARRCADLVLLHHSFCDVLPTVAFATHECPPVVILNHADHLFWLGSAVADMVINLRTVGAEHTAGRRFVPNNAVVPIPLANPAEQVSRRAARRALGIREDQVVLLSVGRDLKYRPCGSYDFVATANKILYRQPGAHLYVVGESASGITPYLRCELHDRLHFVGSVDDPALYRAAADIYLESFPFGSNTALLEAALSGLPIVPAYAPLCPMLVANDDSVSDVLRNPQDEQEYVEQVEQFIQHRDRRSGLGEILRKRLLVDHVGGGWLARLATLYRETDRLTHRPGPIPESRCETTEVDIGLSLWNVVADGKTHHSTWSSSDIEIAAWRHTAFIAKAVGDYRRARRYAWRAVRHDPYQRSSWRLLAITLIGKVGKLMRWILRRA